MKYKKLMIGFLVIILSLVIIFSFNTNSNEIPVKLYKTESCNCCSKYSSYLETKGFNVETIILTEQEIINLKKENNIPNDLYSCHTAFIEGYFVEGHVPVESIEKVLEEKPKIHGIGLSGMPLGSPGMPGIKKGDFIIEQVDYNLDKTVYERR